MGQFKGILLFLALLLQVYSSTGLASNRCFDFFRANPPVSDFYYYPARNERLTVEAFWKKLSLRNARVTKNIRSATAFSQTLSHISRLLEKDAPFDLQTKIKKIRDAKSDRYTFAYLLYLLSYSAHGRRLIKDNFILINGSDFWADNLHLRFKTGQMKILGELDYLAESKTPSLKLNEELRVATAVLIFAHELVHLYNAGAFGIHHVIKNDHNANAMDEVLAHYFQTLIGRDLLRDQAFANYSKYYKDNITQKFYVFSKNSIQKHLTSEQYKFKPKTVKALLEAVHWPDAPL